MAIIEKKKIGENAEEKILKAARKLFMEKGYYAIKIRNIVQEAGVNHALLNYYFRSKKKLFEVILEENISQFMKIISGIVDDEKTSIENKIELLVANYIDMLSLNPDMPLFIIGHAQHIDQRIHMKGKITNSFFMKQIQQAIKSGKIANANPTNLMLNIFSLIIFPFIGSPMFQNNKGLTKKQFNELILERK
ncbi:MAG: TetR/AcrR family transcriptional regulator [Chitinophagaceae bacterium]|nr:TetR/AcrR family transcriptional regulator [Chitinophagaceae bacterium]